MRTVQTAYCARVGASDGGELRDLVRLVAVHLRSLVGLSVDMSCEMWFGWKVAR